MRVRATVEAGQVWRSSDPRRLRAVRVLRVCASQPDNEHTVFVRVLYPPAPLRRPDDDGLGQNQRVPFRAFLTTGTKGLVRLS